MNKYLLIGVVAILVVAGGWWYFNQSSVPATSETAQLPTDQTTQQNTNTGAQPVTNNQPSQTQPVTNTQPVPTQKALNWVGVSMSYPSEWSVSVTEDTSSYYTATLRASNGNTVATAVKATPAGDLPPYSWTTSQMTTSGGIAVTKYVGKCTAEYCTPNGLGQIIYSLKLSDGSTPRIVVSVGTSASHFFKSFEQASIAMDPVVLSIK